MNGTRPKPQLRRDLLSGLRDKGRAVDEKYEDAVERNLDRARFDRETSPGVPQVRTHSASSTTSTLASYQASCSRRMSSKRRVPASAARKIRSNDSWLLSASIAPVRNEIAHVREIDRDRLLRASVACADILEMLKGKG